MRGWPVLLSESFDHLAAQMSGTIDLSYLRLNSIHHTYNRACTIHGVHRLRVQDNVAYDNMGHAFFLEDSVRARPPH